MNCRPCVVTWNCGLFVTIVLLDIVGENMWPKMVFMNVSNSTYLIHVVCGIVLIHWEYGVVIENGTPILCKKSIGIVTLLKKHPPTQAYSLGGKTSNRKIQGPVQYPCDAHLEFKSREILSISYLSDNRFGIVYCRALCKISKKVGQLKRMLWTNAISFTATHGIYLLSGWTPYRKISWSLVAARFGFTLFQVLCALQFVMHLCISAAKMRVKY